MTLDLTMLAWSAALAVLMAVPYTVGMIVTMGLPVAAGNREGLAELPGWMGRSRRAHSNMVENLAPFAALVLAAHLAGRAGALSMLGAQLFFYARLVYAPVYIIGLPYLRTLLYGAGVTGMALILIDCLNG